jgi:hydroxyacylglutathione hydrolase
MVIERSMRDDFLSNTYLVTGEGGGGFFVDAGGPVQPLIERAEAAGVAPTHVLLTHHHGDHVEELGQLLERWPELQVLAHRDEEVLGVTGPLSDGQTLTIDGLEVRVLETPGHTAGMVALLVDGTDVFTGDTLFKGSVGGVRGPGGTSYEDLKRSVMDVLLTLPPETTVRPGHTDPSTVADELESNPFVRIWRGLDPEGTGPCTALGEPATLVLLGPDYDGGTKAWVRWPDGKDDLVPGSKVEPG